MNKGDILGDGTYGIVYSCNDKETGKNYAIKRNLVDHKTLFLSSIREVDLLVKLRKHPNIVTLEYISYKSPFDHDFEPMNKEERKDQRDDNIHFIFGKASYNLYQYIYKIKNPIDFGLRKKYMIQILLAVEYMHNNSILHCDIKPHNILICEDEIDVLGNKNVAKICDFGLSIPYTHQGSQTPDVCTSWYRAPEIILGYPHYDYKSDVWSLGCVMFEIMANIQFFNRYLAGSKMTEKENESSLISRIIGFLPEKPQMKTIRSLVTSKKWRKIKLYGYHDPAKRKSWESQLNLNKNSLEQFEKTAGDIRLFSDLLDNMFQIDWDTRLSVTECIDHPFFEDQKDIIDETRKLYHPRKTLERELHIVPCKERLWVKELALNIYHDKSTRKYKWYNHRTLFQALYLFDHYMIGMYEMNNIPFDNALENPLFTKYDTLLKFYTFLYLCFKYFSVLEYNISFNDIVETQFQTDEAKLEMEKFESGIIQKMDHNVYRTSVYEAADSFDMIMTDSDVLKLLEAYLSVNKPLVTTPSLFIKTLFHLK